MALIAAENLDVQFGRTQVLFGVSLKIEKGEIVTIVGPNGSGKSTLLRCLIGAQKLTKGRILRAAGLKVGYVPQKLQIDPTLPITVRRFLDLPRRVPEDEARQALDQSGAEGLAGRQLADLSGGQFQRVLLARAILGGPDILMLDEPTQGLDQPGAAAFYQSLESIRGRIGCAILMVSHDLHVVMSASDRVVCLNGHVCCEGHPSIVSAAPAYRELFGTGTQGTLALYQHRHDHADHVAHHHHHREEA